MENSSTCFVVIRFMFSWRRTQKMLKPFTSQVIHLQAINSKILTISRDCVVCKEILPFATV